MQKHIEDKGTKFILGTSVEQFSKNSAKLTNGETVDFDILVIAVGVRPNTELVSDAGGKVEKGIITDLPADNDRQRLCRRRLHSKPRLFVKYRQDTRTSA